MNYFIYVMEIVMKMQSVEIYIIRKFIGKKEKLKF